MTEIEGLIERLEKATGPSEELGVRILSALLSTQPIKVVEQSMINGVWCAYYEGFDGRVRLWEAPEPFRRTGNVTASLDTVVALIKRVSPDAMWQVGFDPDDGSMLGRIVTAAPACRHGKGNHEEPAIALLISLLRTLEPNNG